VVTFESGENTTSILMGFTITEGSGTFNTQYNVRWGGGIACWFSGASIISNKIINNKVTDNSAWVYGGGIGAGYLGSDAYVILEKNQIFHNELNSTGDGAFGGGVGLACNGRLINNDISDNSCISTAYESRGGGVLITAESEDIPRSVLIKNNTITHNLVAGVKVTGVRGARGGGIVVHYSKVRILENDISHNRLERRGTAAEAFGAGICMIEANDESLISGNTISHNNIDVNMVNGGGGIRVRSCNVPVINNIVIGNTGLAGGGINFSYSETALINNTLTNNSNRGIYTEYKTPFILNSIVWGNETNDGLQINGSADVFYSDIQGGWEGEGNIDEDPLFVDTISYNLSEHSLCVGAGMDSIQVGESWYYSPETDFYGNPRPYPVDEFVDIGAIESSYFVNDIQENAVKTPSSYELKQNYPNPFNPKTIINYQLRITNDVDLSIYDLLGQKVATLVNEQQKGGYHQVEWDASGFASGIYYYKITTGEFQDVKKMILLR